MSILFSHYLIYTICTIWYISVEISNSILWISFGLQNRYICLRFSYKSRWMFKSRKSLNTLPKGEVQDMSFYYETHRGDSITVINTKYVLETISLCSGKKIQNHCATQPCTWHGQMASPTKPSSFKHFNCRTKLRTAHLKYFVLKTLGIYSFGK